MLSPEAVGLLERASVQIQLLDQHAGNETLVGLASRVVVSCVAVMATHSPPGPPWQEALATLEHVVTTTASRLEVLGELGTDTPAADPENSEKTAPPG